MSKAKRTSRWDEIFPEKFRLENLSPEDRARAVKLLERALRKHLPRLPFAVGLLKLFLLVKDPDATWKDVAPAVGALIYFATPLDAIPDLLPGAGYVDDAALIAAVLLALGAKLKTYEPAARAWLRDLREKTKSSRS